MTAADCAHRVGDIFGADLTSVCGVIHVTAVWRESPKSFITIKINNTSPHSETDFFLLNLTRARADAIITSGKILREEPGVTHDLQGPEGVPEALGSWRAERLGKTSPPLSVVLTSGRELDFAHPLFHAATSPLVFTSEKAAAELAGRAHVAGVELVGREKPSLREAIRYLRGERGLEDILVEAGPSTSRSLYDDPVVVDELVLSVFLGGRLSEVARGAPFLDPQRMQKIFANPVSSFESLEESGRWSFDRHLRR